MNYGDSDQHHRGLGQSRYSSYVPLHFIQKEGRQKILNWSPLRESGKLES